MKARINAKLRKQMNKAMWKVLKPTYFDSIPLDSIFNVLKDFGLVPLQEDYTSWSGFLCGRSGECFMEMGFADSLYSNIFYQPVENSVLRMTWYKMESGRYEVIAYIT